MVYTDTEICNNALALIGEAPITSIDGTGEIERRCKALYDVTVREVQNSFPWQELVTSIQINPVPATEGVNERRFDLPPNYLRALSCFYDATGNSFELDYFIERNQVVALAQKITLNYLSHNSKPSEWSVELSQCVYYQLAIKLAPMVTDNSGVGNNILQVYKQTVEPEARRLQSLSKERTTDKKSVVRGSWNRSFRVRNTRRY